MTIALPEMERALTELRAKYFATPDPVQLQLPSEAAQPDEEFLQQSALALANSDPKIVARAAFVLGNAREKRALPMLVVALEQGNQLVVADLVRAIGLIGDLRALPALHKAWIKGVALEAVAQAIARLGAAESLPFLLMGLKHPATGVRLATIGAIAQIVGEHEQSDLSSMYPGIAQRIEPSLLDVFPPMRVMAACVLAQLGRSFSNAEIRSVLEMRADKLTAVQGFFGGRNGANRQGR